jgi:hypothetical protein
MILLRIALRGLPPFSVGSLFLSIPILPQTATNLSSAEDITAHLWLKIIIVL